jgi:thiol-disulfide isomerase/thioredoxin
MPGRPLVVLLLLWSCNIMGAQSLELADLEGRAHRLADYRGKVVLVNFWATWCAPCREEMPSLERLRQALASRPFVVLAVNVGEGGRVAGDFMNAMPHGFTVLLDRDGGTTRAWGARILPATYVLGPDGEVSFRQVGALDWSSAEMQRRIIALMP